MIEHGETWEDRGERGWRRVVPSPEPVEILDADPVVTLLRGGYVVVCAGGGGVPVVRGPDGRLEGVEAVIDKDLSAALLAQRLGLDTLVIATDVEHAVVGFGSPDARPLGQVDVATMEAYAAGGEFGSGSMGPKVEAALRFARAGGTSIITALDRIGAAVAGEVGTIITNGRNSNA
jgi:carbamate kinase